MKPTHGLAFAFVLMALLSAGPVWSQSISMESRARIQTRIDGLEAVIQGGDLAGAIDVLPPRLLRAMAVRFGLAEADIRPALRAALANATTGVVIESFGINLSAATVAETSDGGRIYLLIPTHTVIQVDGGHRVRTDNQTLAFADEGEWYLIRIDAAAQISMVREAYPEFATVGFPEGRRSPAD